MTNTIPSTSLPQPTAISSVATLPSMAARVNIPNFPSDESTATTHSSSTSKPRKKRRWDQPDESLIYSGVGCPSVTLQGAVPTSSVQTSSLLKGGYAITQAPLLPLQAAVMVQKLNQPKIQEDLVIAREIVINDADPATRYKLTKRQTQDEIQKCTGAVVITRGKYQPPNAVPDGEKPLYLHISSAAHIKETAERILAVDCAAAMVQDMLKQVSQPLSTCVFMGFDTDPSLNIAARIRGPNDQYINHIMNETGATVVLRGHGSGYLGCPQSEEGELPLHLFLSSNTQKSLEDARLLAENLLDTISREFGATRVSSCKLYGAVPPPQQLMVGVPSTRLELSPNMSTSGSMECSVATHVPGVSVSPVVVPVVTTAFTFGEVGQTGELVHPGSSHANEHISREPLATACASYSGYAGIYPQATPPQQVALALKQSVTAASTVAPSTVAVGMVSKSSSNTEKRPPRKRKFQESPATLMGVAGTEQVSGLHVPLEKSSSVKKKIDAALPRTSFKNVPPPPPASSHASMCPPASRSLPLPPPPPPLPLKFPSSTPCVVSRSMPLPSVPTKSTLSSPVSGVHSKDNLSNKPNFASVPDTLVKLMEYGDDDDDDEEVDENEREALKTNPNQIAAAKPFWAA